MLLPDNFAIWGMETIRLPHRTVCTARRNGVTYQLVHADDWWTVTKIHHGQVLSSRVVKHLPAHIKRAVMAARR